MKKISKEEYTILNGNKFFYVPADKSLQCAYCLYYQDTEFVRNPKGLVIGVTVKPENEQHSYDCYQRRQKNE